MDKIWTQLYEAARSVQKTVHISDYITAGEVSGHRDHDRLRFRKGNEAGSAYTGMVDKMTGGYHDNIQRHP